MTEFHLLRSGMAKLQEAWLHAHSTHERQWYENEVAKHLPPIIQRWVREKKNLGCIARWIERNGYHVRRTIRGPHTGRLEFAKGGKILATLEPFTL